MSVTSEFDPRQIANGNFGAAIALCKRKGNEFKGNEVKAENYKGIAKRLEDAEEKLKKIIDYTKSLKTTSGKNFYNEFVKGVEDSVTIAWIEDKILKESNAKSIPIDTSLENIDVKYDFADRLKHGWNDIKNGKGLSNGLVGVCIGAAAGEALSLGVTSLLAKQGIMDGALGLFGVAKLGISNIPALWGLIQTGFSAAWGFSPLMVVAAGSFAILKGIPLFKNGIEKLKEKYNKEHEFEQGLEKMLQDQPQLT